MPTVPALGGHFIGFVRVSVGADVIEIPVQSVDFASDGPASGRPDARGGFFVDGAQYGILVDARASDAERDEAVERAAREAAQHLARRFLN